jgi:preprotein translocase subunit YajC
MKINPRATHQRIIAKRITAPETLADPGTGKNIVLLSYIDSSSYQKHNPTTKGLFLYAAGTSEPGEVPDGLDRLQHHQFIVHLNAEDKAVGLDIVPNRLYRSGVIPKSQDGVTTLIVQYDLDGAVARVTQRPFNTRFEQSAAIIRELDQMIAKGQNIETSTRVGALGRVVNTTENSVEIKLNASIRAKTESDGEEAAVAETTGEQEGR